MLSFFAFMLRVIVMALVIGSTVNFVFTTIVKAIPDSTQPPADNGDDMDDMDDGSTNGMDDGDAGTNGDPDACLEGEPCDDADPCTRNDTCLDGVCQGAPVIDCVLCETNADCDQGDNPCASGSCVQGACLIQNDVAACDDGDPCTESDVCMNGECVGMAIPGCVDGEAPLALSTVVRGDGSIIQDPADTPMEPGQTLTLTAVAFGCAVFDHWEGALSGGENPAMIVLEEGTEVTAVFALDASANLSGEWTFSRRVLSASGDADCVLPLVGDEDSVDVQIVSSSGVLTVTLVAIEDLDADGFADAVPGQLLPAGLCPTDSPFEFVTDLAASNGLIEATFQADTIERCDCAYTSEASFDVAFETCDLITGTQDWTLRRECPGEEAAECSVSYEISAMPAGL